MPCSQIESVKMIMLQVASNHFSISRMPIFAPHIFLFPIKQSCRAIIIMTPDHLTTSVSIYGILFKNIKEDD